MNLRQVFYRLVARELITEHAVGLLDPLSPYRQGPEGGMVPALADNTRTIERSGGWDDPSGALEALVDQYRRPRDEGQEYQLWVLVERRTLVEQLRAWFDPYGVAIVALGRYESETLDRLIRSEVAAPRGENSALLLPAGPCGAGFGGTRRGFGYVLDGLMAPECVGCFSVIANNARWCRSRRTVTALRWPSVGCWFW